MLTIYHVPGTRSARVIWLCEELDQPYELELVDFSPDYRASPEWRAMNPLGKVPVMRDDDWTMFESGAMVEYVLERYGDGRLRPPPGTAAAAEYLQWSWFAEASFARPLGDMAHHQFLKPEAERIPAVVEDARKRAHLCIDALEARLADRDFLLADGRVSGAAGTATLEEVDAFLRSVYLSDRVSAADYIDHEFGSVPNFLATFEEFHLRVPPEVPAAVVVRAVEPLRGKVERGCLFDPRGVRGWLAAKL